MDIGDVYDEGSGNPEPAPYPDAAESPVLHVLPSVQARYTIGAEDLSAQLMEMYGPVMDFQVGVRSCHGH